MSFKRSRNIDFSRGMPPPNGLSRRAQQRLLTLVAMLFLVLILMNQARYPGNWTWLWRLTSSASPPSVSIASSPTTARPGESAELRGEGTPAFGSDAAGWPPGLEPGQLRDVRDDSYFRPAEQAAWFSLWRVLQQTPSDQLRTRSLGEVSYLQIYRQTEAYRGRLVDLSGTIRRANRVSAPPNELGIAGYVQCWLFPDTGPRAPVVVYVLDPPASLQPSLSMAEATRLTGIVYKRWSYQAAEALEVAPVVLAKDLTWLAPTVARPPTARRPNHVTTLAVVVATALAALGIVVTLFRYTSHRDRRSARSSALPPTLSELDSHAIEVRSVEPPNPDRDAGAVSPGADENQRGVP